MAHVVIPDQTPRITYAVGATPLDTFPVPFAFFTAATDLAVYVGGAPAVFSLTPATSLEFNVATTGPADDGFAGGSVTLGTTVTNTTVVVERAIPIDRIEDFPYPSTTLAIRALNRGLDRIAAWGQQLRRDIGRAIALPSADSLTSMVLPDQATRAGTVLGFASDGSIQLFTISGSTVSVYAQWAGTAGGTANARTLTPTPPLGAYATGVGLEFVNGGATNTGAATLNVSGLGAVSVRRPDGSVLTGGEMPANALLTVRHTGSSFRLVNLVPGVSAASETVAGVAELATQAEADAGTDDLTIVTPLKLARRKRPVLAKSGAYAVAVADHDAHITCTGTWTLSLPAVATAGAGFVVHPRNIGAGLITVDPFGAETVDGQATISIPYGFGCTLLCTGTEWLALDFPTECLIRTQVPGSAVAAVDFTLPSAHLDYRVALVGVSLTASIQLGLRTSNNGGVSFAAAAADYLRAQLFNDASNPFGSGTSAPDILVTGTMSATSIMNGELLFHPGSVATHAYAIVSSIYLPGAYAARMAGGGRRDAVGVQDAIRFAAGNIAAGSSFTLFGRRRT